MKLDTRELVLIAVFGALWGAVEAGFGGVLKSLHLPLNGMVLAALGLTIALTGRLFVPKRGSTLFIGAIAMILKLFTIGGVVVGPMIGIMAEAVLAEAVLSLGAGERRPTPLHLSLAGAVGVCWTLVQPFFTGALLFGRAIFDVWSDLVATGSRLLGLDGNVALLIIILLALLHLAVGGAAGLLAAQLGHHLETRLYGQAVGDR